MAYLIKLKNSDIIKITDNEYKQLGGKSGLIFFPSNSETIDTNMIARILPEEKYNLELRENRAKSNTGVLHTGEKAIRYFGQWYLDDGYTVDDPKTGKTRPEKLLDPSYYKEVACDCIPTREEYDKNYAQIPDRTKRLEAILGTVNYHERINEPQSLKKLLEKKAS